MFVVANDYNKQAQQLE